MSEVPGPVRVVQLFIAFWLTLLLLAGVLFLRNWLTFEAVASTLNSTNPAGGLQFSAIAYPTMNPSWFTSPSFSTFDFSGSNSNPGPPPVPAGGGYIAAPSP